MKRRWPFLIAAVVVLGVSVAWLGKARRFSFKGRSVAENGLMLNRNASSPIHPEQAEQDLREFYAAITEYRNRFGRFPGQPRELIVASQKGAISRRIDETNFHSGDMATSDAFDYASKVDANMDEYSFRYGTRRADGTRRSIEEVSTERYVWVVCETYHRANRRMFSGGRVESKPSGFYLVLWSNGKIERLPPGSRMVVPYGQGFLTFFRGETGLPSNAVPEEQFYSRESATLPPNRS